MWIKNSIDTKRTNPWCGLLKPDLEKWHFFYKIDDVKEEVFKRTSYIGRFRKANEKSDGNLTDVLSLSPDEHDMLVPFMKSAMADVFDTLIKFTNTDDNAYSYDENAETKKVNSLEFEFSNSYIRYEDNLIKIAKKEENPIRSHFHLVTGKSNDYILQLKLRVKYNTRYMAGSSCFEENKEAVCDIELNDSNYLDNGVLSGYQFEVVFDADLKPGDGNLSDDEFVGITGVDILSMRVFEKNPAKLHAGDWVEYSGVDGEITLYKVLKDCDTNHEISDTSFFEKQDYDYRGSIHYVIRKPSLLNNNAMKAVDSGIYEALVNLCLSKWFNVSYPDEAGRYYNIYLGEMEKVRMRLQQDIYRHRIIPRAY